MKRSIVIQQTVHGYEDGHSLLAASCELQKKDKNRLSRLSDSAGLNGYVKNQEYITGYPLLESNYYILAKTWYADEMKRPGCVWTHSLLIDIDDISKLGSVLHLLDLFHKPDVKNMSVYTSNIDFVPLAFSKEEIDFQRLQYVVFTMYDSNKSKYIELKHGNYETEILRVLECMDSTLLQQFSFCTNTCINRQIGDKDFTYQIFDKKNKQKIFKTDESRIFYGTGFERVSYSSWVAQYAEDLCRCDMVEWKCFCEKYFDIAPQYEFYNKLYQMFLTIRNENELSIKSLFSNIEQIFGRLEDKVGNRTLSLILYSDLYHDLFKEYYYQLMDIDEKVEVVRTRKGIKRVAQLIVQYNKHKLYLILRKYYVYGKTEGLKYEIMKEVVRLLDANDLAEVSCMNKNIVMALVATSPKMIMAKEIWVQKRRFQCDVIMSLPNEVDENFLKQLLRVVLSKSIYDVSKAMYCKMGRLLILELYKVLQDEFISWTVEKGLWDDLLVLDTELALHQLILIRSSVLRCRLLLKINTYDDEVCGMLTAEEWVQMFKKTAFEQKSKGMQKKLALLFFPIVIKGNKEKFEEISRQIYDVLYRALSEKAISCDEWIMMEKYLLKVKPYAMWDKCQRLQKTFGISKKINVEIPGEKE